MKVAVLGATGGVGTHVVRLLIEAGHDVTVLARTPEHLEFADRLHVVQGSAFDEDAVRATVAGQDVAVSALGSTEGPDKDTSLRRMGTTLAAAAAAEGLPHVVWCASEGIDGEIQGLMGKGVMWLLRKPLADHLAAVTTLKDTPGLTVTVARPRALNDAPEAPQHTEVLDGPAEGGWAIPRANVARFLVAAATEDHHRGQSVALGVTR